MKLIVGGGKTNQRLEEIELSSLKKIRLRDDINETFKMLGRITELIVKDVLCTLLSGKLGEKAWKFEKKTKQMIGHFFCISLEMVSVQSNILARKWRDVFPLVKCQFFQCAQGAVKQPQNGPLGAVFQSGIMS